ncbi:hypothetical protein PR202_gb26357 [Eleusine coracana subsp. coracana]|uniref:WRKY domain-containing protein n=1 Tax=Eleusine coracana subsp. coracana TaxID=191504 RepID=A0AAV5FQY8_ELECO|nr:hypothetical protein PR202_gb26357 [Eleusine coracana subsp. coracana]
MEVVAALRPEVAQPAHVDGRVVQVGHGSEWVAEGSWLKISDGREEPEVVVEGRGGGGMICAFNPRTWLYYRCTYRDDKRCLASKQVQQLNDDEPALYEVLYISEHTCGAPPIPTPVILSEQQTPGARTEGGLVLRFDSAASHRDELVQQQGQYMPAQNSYMMMNFGSSSQMHYQQHVFHYGTGAGASSSSFPAETTLPVPRSTNYSDNGMLSMSELDYSSTCYGFNSHTDFPYNCIN